MGAVPIILNTGAGHQFRKLNTDCDLPGNVLTLDSDAVVDADCLIVAHQPDTDEGYLKYNATTHRWEVSDYAGDYVPISPLVIGADRQEPTGFVDRTATLSWTDGSPDRTLTITGSHSIYIKGYRYDKTTASKQIANTTGLHWIYYNALGTLSESTAFPGFFLPIVATVYWNATTSRGAAADERHGIAMDGATHEYLHDTVGTRFESGLVGSFTNTTFSIAVGVIHDEDIDWPITPAQTTCDVFYQDGSSDWKWEAAAVNIYGAALKYNNGTAWTAVSNGYYAAMWVFATLGTAGSKSIAVIIGQRQDNTLALAKANNTFETLSLGTLPFKEMKLLYRVIYHNASGTPTFDSPADDYRTVSNLSSGTYVATAHSTLTGLLADDHTQYALLAGRTGGQTFTGLAENSPVLTISKTAANSGDLLTIATGASATGNALAITQAGNADAINIVLSHVSAQALVVTTGVAYTNPMVELINNTVGATGPLIKLEKKPGGSTGGACLEIDVDAISGDAPGIRITQGGIAPGIYVLANDSSGKCISVSQTASSGTAVAIAVSGTSATAMTVSVASNSGSSNGIEITKTPASGSIGGTGLSISMNAYCSGAAISITHAGSGNSLTLNHSSIADAINITLGHASAQALVVTESLAGTNPMIQLTRHSGATTAAIDITNPSTDAPGINITQSGGWTGIYILLQTATTQHGVYIEDAVDTAFDSAQLHLYRRSTTATGSAIDIVNDGLGNSIYIEHGGIGDAIAVTLNNVSSQAITIRESAATTAAAIEITRSTTGATGACIAITRQFAVNTAGTGLSIYHYQYATGNNLTLVNYSSGDAINISLDNLTTNQALVVTDNTASNTATMIELTRNANSSGIGIGITANGSGNVIDIEKSPSTSKAGNAIDLNMGANCTGHGVNVALAGTGDAVSIALSHVSAQAIVITESTIGTSPMVELTRSGTAASGNMIQLTRLPASTTSGRGIYINWGANNWSSAIEIDNDGYAYGLFVTQTGSGHAIQASLDGTSAGAIRIVDSTTACINPMVEVIRNSNASGAILDFDNNGSGNAIRIDQGGSGDALSIVLDSSTTANAISISDGTVASSAAMVVLSRNANATGRLLDLTNNGSGNAIYLIQNGSADALAILLSASARAIGIGESVACSASMLYLQRTQTSSSGAVVDIGNDGTGNSVSIVHSGAADAISVSLDSNTSAQALVITDNAIARTSNLIQITSNANSTGDAVLVTQSGSGDGITIDKSPATSKAGYGINLVMGSNCTSRGFYMSYSGSGEAFYISTGTNEYFYVNNVGTTRVNTNTNVTTLQAWTNLSTGLTANITVIGTDHAASASYRLIAGYVASTNLIFSVYGDGNVKCDGSFTGGGADYAELVPVLEDKHSYVSGEVLIVAGEQIFDRSDGARSACVAGVVSETPCFVGNGVVEREDGRNVVTMAMMGLVHTRCSTENGAISPGDLLCTSSLPGYAMKAGNSPRGTILGKAVATLNDDGTRAVTGLIQVYVNLQ